MRIFLAIQCFFLILFGKALPTKALPVPVEPEDKKREREQLAADVTKKDKRLQDLEIASKTATAAQETLQGELESVKTERDEARQAADEAKKAAAAAADTGELDTLRADLQKAKQDLAESTEKAGKQREAKEAAQGKLKEARDHGALALLAWLQREGRLIDFLKENIDDYEDEQVGAAVRAIHKGCLKVLDEGLALEAILEGEEESPVQVEKGFDPVAIQLTGNVKGEPPFKGTLMHGGWRASRVKVPVPETVDPHVLAPAEVEL